MRSSPPAQADKERGGPDDAHAAAVVAALALALTLPLWLNRFPVAQDLAAHVETAAQIRGLWAGDPALGARYQLHALPWPNALPTMAMAPLTNLVDGLVAAKVLLALGVFAWPLSLLVLFRRLGRSPWFALLTLPTCFDLSFSYGFLHFVVGKPLWALALVAAIDAKRTPTVPRLLALSGALVALFCTHLVLFATAVPLCVLVVLVVAPASAPALPPVDARRRESGASWAALTAILVGALPALAWWTWQRPAETSGGATEFLPLGETLARLWTNLGDLNAGSVDAVPWVVCAAAGVFVVLDAARAPGAPRVARRDQAALAVVAGAVGAFALFGPVRTPHVSVVAERFTAVAWALLAGVPAVALRRRHVGVIAASATLAVGVAVADVTHHWGAFNADDMGDFDALLARIPDGARVATHYTSPLSKHGRHNATWHWPKLVALRGGVTDDSFAWRSTSVVGLRRGQTPPRAPRLDPRALAAWDYLLVRSTAPSDPGLARALAASLIEPVTATGTWTLYRIVSSPPATARARGTPSPPPWPSAPPAPAPSSTAAR